jgi:hypothetical protein
MSLITIQELFLTSWNFVLMQKQTQKCLLKKNNEFFLKISKNLIKFMTKFARLKMQLFLKIFKQQQAYIFQDFLT